MDDARVRQITGISGVALGLATIVAIPLYFMYPGPPPAWNLFTRDSVGLISVAFLILFFTGSVIWCAERVQRTNGRHSATIQD